MKRHVCFSTRTGTEMPLVRFDDSAGLAMFAAADDESRWRTHRMVEVMQKKELPHTIDTWPSPAGHHERWWGEQLACFLERRFPPIGSA